MKSQVKFVCLFISHRPLPPRDSRRLRRNRVIPVLRSLSNVVMIITIPAVNRHDCPLHRQQLTGRLFVFPGRTLLLKMPV